MVPGLPEGRGLTFLSMAENPSFCQASKLGRGGWDLLKEGLHRGWIEGSRERERASERSWLRGCEVGGVPRVMDEAGWGCQRGRQGQAGSAHLRSITLRRHMVLSPPQWATAAKQAKV